MNNMQDLTQKERVEEGLLGQLIGGGCSREAQSAWQSRREVAYATEGKSNCGSCSCGEEDSLRACGFGVEDGVLAAVWTPMNRFDSIYDKDTAFRRGTMFAALDKPFYGGEREVDCRGNER